DGDSKTADKLLSARQTRMECPADSNTLTSHRMPKFQDYKGDPCMGREGVTCKKIGTETINGRSCDKWEVTQKNGDKETIWIDQKLHFPIKSQTAGGMTTEFTNIRSEERRV